MKYTVSQTFETIGDPCPVTFAARGQAEDGADAVRGVIIEMVMGWETDDSIDGHTPALGQADENEAWERFVYVSSCC